MPTVTNTHVHTHTHISHKGRHGFVESLTWGKVVRKCKGKQRRESIMPRPVNFIDTPWRSVNYMFDITGTTV